MRLEIWMIVGAGVAFAVGFGVVTVLLLGLHAEVRKLTRTAEGLRRGLAANLREVLPPRITRALPPKVSEPVPSAAIERAKPRARPAPQPEAPAVAVQPKSNTSEASESLDRLASAAAAPEPPASGPASAPALSPPASNIPEPLPEPAWNPDRRLLVMRLASRGEKPDQIAAALRIPEDEVEHFLQSNRLAPVKQPASTV